MDGIQYGARVTNFTSPKEYAAIVDAILNSTTFASRTMRMAKPFNKTTMRKNVKVSRTNQGQWFQGLTTLNSSAVQTTIQLEFGQNLYTAPIVDVLDEAFARETSDKTVDEPGFRYEETISETMQDLSDAMYGVGSSTMPLGLGAIVDDGTNKSNYGGQSRTTYDMLNATVTDSSGIISLAKMATMEDAISDTGEKETMTTWLTTQSIWNLYESLLTPTITTNASTVGYNKLGVSDFSISKPGQLKGGLGFTALTFRGVPIIKDKACTSGVLFGLNEHYLNWYGRNKVPAGWKGELKNISLGKAKVIENRQKMPSSSHGFFRQSKKFMVQQAGSVERIYLVGQMLSWAPRRQGKLTGITSIA
ncbi:MAG: hypothetical protein B6226_03495 [Candidatus Cloacimonetes bacterium 4572_65]|nr:MAG: hypothetical protein B6226_03495 [Candidatus Cloacimonetes bacterium 4572_65]